MPEQTHMTDLQKQVATVYAAGEFKHLIHERDWRARLDTVGDTLFRFLMVELSAAEDCNGLMVALFRLETAIRQLTDVRDALFTYRDAQLLHSFRTSKSELFDGLARAGVARVMISYDGECDSGQIESIEATSASEETVDLKQYPALGTVSSFGEPQTLESSVDAFAWDILTHYHGGFENNDGGFGTITLDIPASKAVLNHNDRVVDVATSEQEV